MKRAIAPLYIHLIEDCLIEMLQIGINIYIVTEGMSVFNQIEQVSQHGK